ncbi:LysR substrate-binding domain-containing protein [Pantoea ananatis]
MRELKSGTHDFTGCCTQQELLHQYFQKQRLSPAGCAYSSPSIEMVRCMVGQGLGSAVLVTRPYTDMTYDGENLAQIDIEDEMEASTLIMAWLSHNEPTRPTKLFMDYCQNSALGPTA